MALTQCNAFLFFVTPLSVTSSSCLREINFCLSRERKILCVHLDQVQLPIGLELSLSDTQAILRADHPREAYEAKLSEALQGLLQVRAVAIPPRDEPADDSDEVSIAILPLVNRTNDPANEYLGHGIAEELINGLTHVAGLRVASQMSAFAYKDKQTDIGEIGRKLRVNHALSGSVQKSGERVRINIRLDRTRDGTTLWSERYDRVLDDIFELQDDIAKQVVEALAVELKQPRTVKLIDVGTDNAEAYNEYLLGTNEYRRGTRRSLVQALDHFERAVALDPDFRSAHMGKVQCCAALLFMQHGAITDLQSKGAEALEHAKRLGHKPDLPWIRYRQLLFPDEIPDLHSRARLACEKIRTPDPEWRGIEYLDLVTCLVSSRLFQGALQFIDRYPQHVCRPRDLGGILGGMGTRFKGLCLGSLGRFQLAIDAMNAFLETDADPSVRADLVHMYSRTGQFDRAEEELRNLSSVWRESFPYFHHLYWKGDRDGASAYLHGKNFPFAMRLPGLIMLEEFDEAVECLDQAIDVSGQAVVLFDWTYRYLCPPSIIEAIESHAGFNTALERIGIDDAWRDELVQMVNELEDVTGIHIERDPHLS